MKVTMSPHYATGLACALLALGGCSGAGGASSVPAAVPLREQSKQGPLVYVSDSLGSFVDVFTKDGTLTGKITTDMDYPVELFVDAKHNLWVANSLGNDVLRFRRGVTKPSIYTGVQGAYAATTCPDGTLYVTDFGSKIAVFAPGHHSPTGSLTENYGEATSISCDPSGNVFVTATLLSPPGYVVEFPAGSTEAKLLPINLPNPVDAKPDPAGNLLVLDSAGGHYNTITEYTEAGQPTGKAMALDDNWSEMVITPNGKKIFGADVNALDGTLRLFRNDKQLQSYQDSKFKQLGGIAFDPGT
ncbi:MAG TPA: hypothetical protein VHT92_03860 [Candidatus Cybelea sp.]|jgi:hypothetical protein|nr:hypothetical protein [Candidatus Cybelea sp.]